MGRSLQPVPGEEHITTHDEWRGIGEWGRRCDWHPTSPTVTGSVATLLTRYSAMLLSNMDNKWCVLIILGFWKSIQELDFFLRFHLVWLEWIYVGEGKGLIWFMEVAMWGWWDWFLKQITKAGAMLLGLFLLSSFLVASFTWILLLIFLYFS